jgi:hypothetical protein
MCDVEIRYETSQIVEIIIKLLFAIEIVMAPAA